MGEQRKITKAGGVRCGNPLWNKPEILIVPAVAGGDLLGRVSDRPVVHVPPRHAMSGVMSRLARVWFTRRLLERHAADFSERHGPVARPEDR